MDRTLWASAAAVAVLLTGCTDDGGRADPAGAGSSSTSGGVATDAAAATPVDAPPPAADLQAALDALVQRADGPLGAIVALDVDGEVSTLTAGTAEAGTDRPPTVTDHVRVASLTKAMTGAAAWRLVADGVLALDDTVGELRPDLPSAWHPVTLRQLLTHTSGIPDLATPAFGEAVQASPDAAPPPEQILALVDPGTDFAPGERYQYSNSNPFVTGLMIERATGATLAEVLAEQVFAPLGMTSTSLPGPDDPSVPDPSLRGEDPLTDGTTEDVTEVVAFGGWAWASGGIVSTPADLHRFIRGYVGGAVVDGELQASQYRFVEPGASEPAGPGANGAGPALFRYDTRCGTVYGHTGSILGATQFMAATPDGSRSVTFTINSQYAEDLLPELRAAQELAVCRLLAG